MVSMWREILQSKENIWFLSPSGSGEKFNTTWLKFDTAYITTTISEEGIVMTTEFIHKRFILH